MLKDIKGIDKGGWDVVTLQTKFDNNKRIIQITTKN